MKYRSFHYISLPHKTKLCTPLEDVPRVTLKLRKPRTDRKVKWTSGTVDNENMNKKKSKYS
ncbi:hypothetical protein NQ317_008849 [Molorchus minor]|uniref:Ribosomal protein L32 n=1 Tax=Molorchus minor TaxID=1323400 RepID=A0ABQ9IV44_9CUCU|nr:hypothetical protein NQ317_008849 [Molorchus minor]